MVQGLGFTVMVSFTSCQLVFPIFFSDGWSRDAPRSLCHLPCSSTTDPRPLEPNSSKVSVKRAGKFTRYWPSVMCWPYVLALCNALALCNVFIV